MDGIVGGVAQSSKEEIAQTHHFLGVETPNRRTYGARCQLVQRSVSLTRCHVAPLNFVGHSCIIPSGLPRMNRSCCRHSHGEFIYHFIDLTTTAII